MCDLTHFIYFVVVVFHFSIIHFFRSGHYLNSRVAAGNIYIIYVCTISTELHACPFSNNFIFAAAKKKKQKKKQEAALQR